MEDLGVYVITWNVGTSFPLESEQLHGLLGLEPNSNSYVNVPDIYVIGLQEVKSQPQNMLWNVVFEDPWTEKFKEILGEIGLVKIQTLRQLGLQTSIFIKRTHLVHLRDIETQFTRRGLGGILGNKGAISLRFELYSCSIVFVNCHLTPHDHLLQERIEDYKQILTTQQFSLKETSNILYHDYVFWFGDLNFRLGWDQTAEQLIETISKESYRNLLVEDQLKIVQGSGDAFSELQEPPIHFRPTYKVETGFDNYDIKRRPAWTDRILYQVNANVYDNVTLKADVNHYKSHLNYRGSDHRPVTAHFTIKIFRPTPEKMIEFIEPLPHWRIGQNNKVFYKVCSTLETFPEDWIAIYKSDFTSLDDYKAYTYVQQYGGLKSEEIGNSLTYDCSIIFSESTILFEGSYVLVYYSKNPRSIYAISKEFQAFHPRNTFN